MQQRNATLTSPSWWGAMMSAFAFSGVHTDPNTETHKVDIFFGTWFQKSVGSENAGSLWTVGLSVWMEPFHQVVLVGQLGGL